MASIINGPDGRKSIQFTLGKRRPIIRLGRATLKQAERFRDRVEDLISATLLNGLPHEETTKWLASLDPQMRNRLAAAGLTTRQRHGSATLEYLFDEFFKSLKVKQGTATTNEQTRDCLFEYFSKGRLIRDIDHFDAGKWRQWMEEPAPKGKGLAAATISKRIKTARRAFAKALRWKMITENPFDGIEAGPQNNPERSHFIDRATAQKVLDACPNAEWRVIFALSRFGGLRCPSEHLELKWTDVDWHKGTILVTSPKTERYKGRGSRLIPLFPELREYLMDLYGQLAEGAGLHVITRYRDRSQNLRTQLERILRRAGVAPWPRLFHNLRASRQTELEERFPGHVVCQWLGNSERIAAKHYLQVLDSHFEGALQNPMQQGDESGATETKTPGPQNAKGPEIPVPAFACNSLSDKYMTPTGFETSEDFLGKTGDFESRAAKSDAFFTFRGRVLARRPRPTKHANRDADRERVHALLSH